MLRFLEQSYNFAIKLKKQYDKIQTGVLTGDDVQKAQMLKNNMHFLL